MSTLRRVASMVAAATLGWTALTQVVAAPSARADAPHDPATYYAGTDGLTGAALETKLHTIVSPHTRLSYDDLWTALPATDVDPANSADIIDVYSGTSLLASNMCNHSGSCAGQWNREHSWAKSHGDFGTVDGPGTDLFHMRPELADVNSTRGNLDFDNGGTVSITNCALCKKDSDSFEPRDAIKGDIARGLFYMAVAYDGGDGFPDLVLNDFTCNAGSKAPNHGKLSTLISWSLNDPPDDVERARNDLIDGSYQHNRNPFIDHPEWVPAIWGTGVGQGPACGTTTGGGGDPGDGTPPNIVISEAYVNGGSSGATYKNKYVELFNPLTSAVDLSGYSLQYRSPTGTGAATGIYNFFAGASIAAGGYFVVKLPGNTTGAGADLPHVDGDGSSTSVNPGGAGGTLFLAGIHALVPPDDDSVGDTIGWGSSNAPETSPATGNGVIKSLQRNGCNSDTDVNSADFTALAPTPGVGSGSCTPPANHAPTTAPMTGTTAEDTQTTVPLTASDLDSDPLAWTVSQTPGHGSASITDSTLTYTPAADYHGTDVVGVTVSDGHGGTAGATVTIAVSSVDDTPVAHDVAAGLLRNTSTQIALDASDVDDTDLTYAVEGQPAHGAVTIGGSTATYQPATGYVGGDSFTYTATDPAHATSAPATVSITVTRLQQPPTATAVEASTDEDHAATFTLTASDPDDDPLTFGLESQPVHGSVVLDGDHATYTPTGDFHGNDTFTWSTSDGVTQVTAPATVEVGSVNDVPVASDGSKSLSEDSVSDITLAASDADDDQLTFAVGTGPQHGAVQLVGSTATYTPDADFHGSDAFTFTASDGSSTSAPAAVMITVSPVNDAPVAHPATPATDEDNAVSFALPGSDVDGDLLAYSLAGQPTHGSVTLTGAQATYTPAPDFNGPDSFGWTVSDGSLTSSGTASVTVSRVNDAPTAADLAASTDEDSSNGVMVALAGHDVDDDKLTYAAGAVHAAHGTVTFALGTAKYVPDALFSGTDTFSYTASDDDLTSAPATVTVSVNHVNHLPVVSAVQLSTTAGSPVSTTLQVSDPDGESVSIASTTAPAHGSVTFVGTTLTYTPARSGSDSFFVTVSDGHGGTASAQVGVAVTAKAAQLAFSGKAKRGHRARLTVAVGTVGGVAATGQLTLRVGSKTLTAPLVDGVARFGVRHLPASRKLKVTASYAGDGQYAPATAKHSYPIKG